MDAMVVGPPETRSTAPWEILLCDAQDNLIALGHTVPFLWNGNLDSLPPTIDEVFVRAIEVDEQRHAPNTLCAMAAIVAENHQRQGLSSKIIGAMKPVAAQYGVRTLIAPVRPTLKSRYPLTPMERYVDWLRPDETPFDPWIRVHWRLGAVFLKVAPRALVVTGTVEDWERWTQMQFPESGPYVVPGALQPVVIDRELDAGRYEDPNVWMKYAV
jgi:hypothetical protein